MSSLFPADLLVVLVGEAALVEDDSTCADAVGPVVKVPDVDEALEIDAEAEVKLEGLIMPHSCANSSTPAASVGSNDFTQPAQSRYRRPPRRAEK